MKRIACYLAAAMLALGAGSTDAFAANKCGKQKTALSQAKSKQKSADATLRKANRDVLTLQRVVDRDTNALDREAAKHDRRVLQVTEAQARLKDRAENQRLDLYGQAANLRNQAALCIGGGLLNGIIGTTVECTADDRNQLIAEALRLEAKAEKIQLQVDSAGHRAERTIESYDRQYATYVRTQQQKLNRDTSKLNSAIAKVPAAQAKSDAAGALVDTKQQELDSCLFPPPA